MSERVYYEKWGLSFRKSESWEFKLYKFNPDYAGDTGTLSAERALNEGRVDFIKHCFALLKQRIRWPNEFNVGKEKFIAKNRWKWEISKWKRFGRRICRLVKEGTDWGELWKNLVFNIKNRNGWEITWETFIVDLRWKRLDKVDQVLFRPQNGITRDPFTWGYAADILENNSKELHTVSPPLRIFSPTFWMWVKFIKYGKRERLYLWLENRKPIIKPRSYVNKLKDIRLKVYNHKKSES